MSPPTRMNEPTPDYASTVRRVLETRYDEAIDINTIADSLFISPDYLRRVFRRQFGRSPVDYLIQRRVEVASEMLRHTDAPVRTIAERCGFGSPYYFSRVFQKAAGLSPSAYRARHGA